MYREGDNCTLSIDMNQLRHVYLSETRASETDDNDRPTSRGAVSVSREAASSQSIFGSAPERLPRAHLNIKDRSYCCTSAQPLEDSQHLANESSESRLHMLAVYALAERVLRLPYAKNDHLLVSPRTSSCTAQLLESLS